MSASYLLLQLVPCYCFNKETQMAHKATLCQLVHSVPTVAPASFLLLGIMGSSFYWSLLSAALTDRSGNAFHVQGIVCSQRLMKERGAGYS